MSYRWRHLLNQLPLPLGMRSDWRLPTTGLRQAQLVSHLQQTGFTRHHGDRHERSLRRRRIAQRLFKWAVVLGAVWIVFESVRAACRF